MSYVKLTDIVKESSEGISPLTKVQNKPTALTTSSFWWNKTMNPSEIVTTPPPPRSLMHCRCVGGCHGKHH